VPTRGQKWRDLHQELLGGIRSGRYPVGTAMPSIPDLIAEGRGSDSTIKRAYQELRAAGLVEARRGSGHWVIRSTSPAGVEERLTALEERVERLERGDA
jgi:GntR family transcriptional regulator